MESGRRLGQEQQYGQEGHGVEPPHPVEAGFHAVRVAQPSTRERAHAETTRQKQIKNSHVRAALLRRGEVTDVGVGDGKDQGDAPPLEKATDDEVEDVRGVEVPQREQAAKQLSHSNKALT